MVLIPKGKGNLCSPKAWRGIALKCCPYKVLTSLVADRVQWLADKAGYIPKEQHGFVKGKSTLSALEILKETVGKAWVPGGEPVYAVFVDFRAAFDRASRSEIASIISGLGAGVKLRRLIQEILQEDRVVLLDGEKELDPIQQTTGVAQGDCLSPLLFILLLGQLPRVLADEVRSVRVLLYADDLVLFGKHKVAVQMAVQILEKFCVGRGLYINEDKTVAVKFRAGGRVSRKDRFWVNGRMISIEKDVFYLGVKLSCCGNVEGHIRDRVRRAKVAIARIRKPQLLSIKAAVEVFALCIAPVASYGLRLLWEKMNIRMLAILESVKATFLKRCLGVAVHTRNRLVYALTGEGSFIEELMSRNHLERHIAVEEYVQSFNRKVRDVLEGDFFRGTPVGRSMDWKGAGRPGRSLVVRVSLHGLHRDFCFNRRCFEATLDCKCRYCGGNCEQDHMWACASYEGVSTRRQVEVAEKLECNDPNIIC